MANKLRNEGGLFEIIYLIINISCWGGDDNICVIFWCNFNIILLSI